MTSFFFLPFIYVALSGAKTGADSTLEGLTPVPQGRLYSSSCFSGNLPLTRPAPMFPNRSIVTEMLTFVRVEMV